MSELKEYVGIKSIDAKPMTRGEHSISKGFNKVLTGLAEDEGYQVIYEDGYESWSPKKAFEDAYVISNIDNFTDKVKHFASDKGWYEVSCYNNSDCKQCETLG